MSEIREPLYYAKASVETMMRKFAAVDLPPKGRFHYHQGVFLSGVYKIYQACGDERYFRYMKDWVDSCVDENGNIIKFNEGQLDDLLVGDVCIGTGVGDYLHYCNRPVSINDLHGVGAFLIMCSEMHKSW